MLGVAITGRATIVGLFKHEVFETIEIKSPIIGGETKTEKRITKHGQRAIHWAVIGLMLSLVAQGIEQSLNIKRDRASAEKTQIQMLLLSNSVHNAEQQLALANQALDNIKRLQTPFKSNLLIEACFALPRDNPLIAPLWAYLNTTNQEWYTPDLVVDGELLNETTTIPVTRLLESLPKNAAVQETRTFLKNLEWSVFTLQLMKERATNFNHYSDFRISVDVLSSMTGDKQGTFLLYTPGISQLTVKWHFEIPKKYWHTPTMRIASVHDLGEGYCYINCGYRDTNFIDRDLLCLTPISVNLAFDDYPSVTITDFKPIGPNNTMEARIPSEVAILSGRAEPPIGP
jgi:hypothetical protein